MSLENDLNHIIAATLCGSEERPSPFSLAFEQAERELGERIGFPALVYQSGPYTTAQTGAKYTGMYRDGAELSEAQTAAEMNRLNRQVARLRAELASAHEHVGAFIAAYQHEHAALDTYEATRGTEAWELAGMALEEAEIATARCISAARAWLRDPPGEDGPLGPNEGDELPD